jgi:hypothetical protein
MAIADEPTLTDLYDRADQFRPISGSAYVFAKSVEQRSEHLVSWITATDVTRVEIVHEGTADAEVAIQSVATKVTLRSRKSLADLWRQVDRPSIYLDITGLSHHIWAPLLRSALQACADVMVVYVEPGEYRFDPAPTEGQIFDLSERISGVAPLPGFASLTRTRSESSLFVPLLGFEGRRLAYLIEQVQPANERIIPIVGVPGFRIEYPFHTYAGNKRVLLETGAWQRVRYATANCPFGLFYALEAIAKEFPQDTLRVAPIGTKPHALGAILFTLVNRQPVEIVYDHPVRKVNRTQGADRLLVYHVSPFAVGNP